MRDFKYIWVVGLVVTLLLVAIPVFAFVSRDETPEEKDPWAYVAERVPDEVDHTALIEGPFESGPEVTAACLECHEEAGEQMLDSVHWRWEGEPVVLEGREEPVTIGKKNQINNFCISIEGGNYPGCTRCHAGYGWETADFDFTEEENIDCLVCHDQTGAYVKSTAGRPAEGVDLVAAAQSVGAPTRANCGGCHFEGGGGNGVKHGDLDGSLFFPTADIDVHMGEHDFQCIDCHKTEDHSIRGRAMSVSVNDENQVRCTDCHSETVHEDERINEHVDSVACQSCHIPQGAVRDATKMFWDWSAAGQDLPEDPHVYLKIKGSFIYENNFTPEYAWYNGTADRYILGDKIDPNEMTLINEPLGDITDPTAKIWPFKIHRATQIYDAVYNYFLTPKTVGEGGYWTEFDWDLAARLGAEAVGMEYSGEYGFAPSAMYWPQSHMVQAKEYALQCSDCHGEDGRMDWEALGYHGDPMIWGGREGTSVGMTE